MINGKAKETVVIKGCRVLKGAKRKKKKKKNGKKEKKKIEQPRQESNLLFSRQVGEGSKYSSERM